MEVRRLHPAQQAVTLNSTSDCQTNAVYRTVR